MILWLSGSVLRDKQLIWFSIISSYGVAPRSLFDFGTIAAPPIEGQFTFSFSLLQFIVNSVNYGQ